MSILPLSFSATAQISQPTLSPPPSPHKLQITSDSSSSLSSGSSDSEDQSITTLQKKTLRRQVKELSDDSSPFSDEEKYKTLDQLARNPNTGDVQSLSTASSKVKEDEAEDGAFF